MEPRFAVVVFPPAEAVAAAEEFRRLHDPHFHRIAAHVAVVPALSWRTVAEALPRRAQGMAAVKRGPFPVNPSGAGRTKGGTVFVKGDEGAGPLGDLTARLVAALAPPAGMEFPAYVPVMGIGRAP